MRDAGGTESTDRWEDGLRTLARLSALCIHDVANSRAYGRLPEQDAEAHDAASTEVEKEPE